MGSGAHKGHEAITLVPTFNHEEALAVARDDDTTVNIQDQRSVKTTKVSMSEAAIRAYCDIAAVDLSTAGELKIRLRDHPGPYGFTQALTNGGFRVVLNVIYDKEVLSEAARYVLSNTLLHELHHVAQAQQMGWGSLDPSHDGWSETEAREYGRLIKGHPLLYTVE